MKRSNKKKIQYSIAGFSLLLILIFFLADLMQSNTDKILAQEIQNVLDIHKEDTYTVGEPLLIPNTVSTLGNFYSVTTKQNQTLQTSVVRLMGIAGPVSAIFLHDNNETDFIGMIGFSNVDTTNQHGITDNQISYWEDKLSIVLLQHFEQEGIE